MSKFVVTSDRFSPEIFNLDWSECFPTAPFKGFNITRAEAEELRDALTKALEA